jgi:Tat protein translocase TatB subunit
MDFFGIGPWEIFLILVVALLVLGPEKIPGIARTLGRTVRAIRKASSELTTAVTKEFEEAEKASNKPAPPRAARLPDPDTPGDPTPEDIPTETGGTRPAK